MLAPESCIGTSDPIAKLAKLYSNLQRGLIN
jgi:hypothetical protein